MAWREQNQLTNRMKEERIRHWRWMSHWHHTHTLSDLKGSSASSGPDSTESISGNRNAAASACHPVFTEAIVQRNLNIEIKKSNSDIYILKSGSVLPRFTSGTSGHTKHTNTQLQIVTSRKSPNNINISTHEGCFSNLRLGVLRKENSHEKTFR